MVSLSTVVLLCAGLVAASAQTPAPAAACTRNGGISAGPAGTDCLWEADAMYNGTVVTAGAENNQTSALACCESCREAATETEAGEQPCNSWTWCGNPDGCCTQKGGCPADDDTLMPFQGCTLLYQEGLQYAAESPKPVYSYNASDVAAWGPGSLPNTSATTSGVYLPDIVDAEQMPGYETYPGQDVSNDNYLCPGSLYQGEIIGGCRLNGTVTELAAGCSADPQCSAFTYQPYGCCTNNADSEMSESGWRKTGDINPQCNSFLPHTILYVMTDRGAASS